MAALVLSGINTYTGGTTVAAGILQFNGDSAVPSGSGSITIDGGATLALTPTGPAARLPAGSIAARLPSLPRALALIADSSETITMGNYAGLSLGS